MSRNLPVELIVSVLEWAYFDTTYTPDRVTLAGCCLVCHSWKNAAQTLLFRSIVIHGPTTLKQLTDAFVQRPQLGSCVRILQIYIGADTTVDPSALPRTLRLVPRLYELHLFPTGVIELPPPIVEELQTVANSPSPLVIRSLVLSGMGVQSRILYQMLQIWPTIQHLRLESELAGSPPEQRPPFRLYELILSRMPSAENITWLLADNDNALRFLDLRDDPSAAFNLSLGDQAKHIRCLRLVRYNILSAPLVRRCTNLKEFLLWAAPIVFPMRDVPQTIEHFGFRTPLQSLLGNKISFILTTISGWPKLGNIVCNHEDMKELEEIVFARGIKATFRSMLPINVCEDPVVVRYLPRGKCVDNFSLMN